MKAHTFLIESVRAQFLVRASLRAQTFLKKKRKVCELVPVQCGKTVKFLQLMCGHLILTLLSIDGNSLLVLGPNL